ncbi:MAG: serine--tRNA ligase [Candidatus Thermoplasmatota archaeon]|nr:serine--tRNA ligase [Candidatus Thermoplasmatota archaeon]
MEYDLTVTYTLSKPAADLQDFLSAFVEDAHRGILQKGAREEGARITEWRHQGDAITLRILSRGSIRSHQAAVRVYKALSQQLGQEHHIGVRDMTLKTYHITMNLEEEPREPVTIPFAQVTMEGKRVHLLIENQEESFLRDNYVDRMINRVREKVEAQCYAGKKEYWELIWQSPAKQPAWQQDPSEELQQRGWLAMGTTKGKWFYRPPAAAILRAMENLALEEVVRPLGFQEVVQPMHVSLATWLKTGHLEGMPGEIYYLSEPQTRDPRQWQRFVDLVKITREVPEEELQANLKVPRAGVCYAQCPNIYASLAGKTIADDSLPVLLFDRSVPSDRYESGGRHGIERVDEFHRIEVLYIGTREQLLDLREQLTQRYRHVFNHILDLEWRMARVAPFYLQQAGIAGGEEEADRGTMDFEAWLPYRGDREQEWLEIQNISIVGDKYTRAFTIKGQKADLWSGCSGIGLERWMVAFLAQKGLDPEGWPDGFKRYCPSLPPMTEFL